MSRSRPSHPVTALLSEHGRVVGVRADGPEGPVEVRGPVVLATSTYDWDPDLVREMVELEPEDFGSVAPESLRGDGIKLAREVGVTKVTMSALVADLVDEGRVLDVGTAEQAGPGKRATLVDLDRARLLSPDGRRVRPADEPPEGFFALLPDRVETDTSPSRRSHRIALRDIRGSARSSGYRHP